MRLFWTNTNTFAFITDGDIFALFKTTVKRYYNVLRSESPSGICVKLRTVAASNNRVHPTRSLNYCLFAPNIYGVVLRAHSVRGEPRI